MVLLPYQLMYAYSSNPFFYLLNPYHTNKCNLTNLCKNASFIETSEKVFFTKGAKGILVLVDVWIKWLVLRPKNNFIYGVGVFLMHEKTYYLYFY